MAITDYQQLFEQSSATEVVVDTNFTIVAASDLFLKASWWKTAKSDTT